MIFVDTLLMSYSFQMQTNDSYFISVYLIFSIILFQIGLIIVVACKMCEARGREENPPKRKDI